MEPTTSPKEEFDEPSGRQSAALGRLATWPTASLRTYLVGPILLATLPVAILLFYMNFADLRLQRQRLGDGFQQTALLLSQSVEREMISSLDALKILSYNQSVQRGDIARYAEVMSFPPRLRSSWHSVYLLDNAGLVLFDTDQQGLPNGAPAPGAAGNEPRSPVSNLLRDRFSGGYFTSIETPVMVEGVQRYTVGARIKASVWQKMLEEAGAPPGGFISIFDRDYRVVARTLAPERSIGERLPDSITAAMKQSSAGIQQSTLMEGGAAYGAWQKIGLSGWGVGVGVSARPLWIAQWRAVMTTLGTALGCILVGVFLALFAAKRVTDPLRHLALKGPARTPKRIAVREIALLRDALLAAQMQDETAHIALQAKRDLLQRKANEFETLFESTPIGLAFAQDPQCRLVMHNAAMNALFGVSDSSGTGVENGGVQVFHDDRLLERENQPLQRAAAFGESVKGSELKIRIDDQPPIYVLVNAVPLLDLLGRPRGAIGAVVDITDRKLAEARLLSAETRLRESQNLVELAQEAGHVGFFQYQFKEDVLSFTPGHAKLLGMDLMQSNGSLENWLRRIKHEDRGRVESSLQLLLTEQREKETLEYRIALPDGSERWLSSRMVLTYDPEGQPLYMIGISIDATEQKYAEQERAALIEREKLARLEAEEASRAKDEFLAMLGHELRNPLSAISSAVEVLNRVEGDADVATNARRIIARQTAHLAHMMNDLLDVARVITGKVLLSRRSHNLAALVERVMATLEMAGETQHHQVLSDVEEVWIDADVTRIEQIITNLLTNAIKYTPSGGKIGIEVRQESGTAVLEVRDTGVGIPAQLLPRVFDLFVQGERTLDRRSGGLGIGLTLVRRLVELHDGTIGVESSNAGSLFTVRLPAVHASVGVEDRPRLPESRRRNVTVIEDNPDALNALAVMLKLDGHTVRTAGDGADGLALLLEARPHAALVDIGLPSLNGYEVAMRARAAGYTGRMIALSGYGQERDVKQALSSGFDAYLVKPIDTDALRTLLCEE